MIGLKRGTVRLIDHQDEWIYEAENTIGELKKLMGTAAIDIQHIGSTAISSIHAKPIIDIVIGVRELNDIHPYINVLKELFKYYKENYDKVPSEFKNNYKNEKGEKEEKERIIADYLAGMTDRFARNKYNEIKK